MPDSPNMPLKIEAYYREQVAICIARADETLLVNARERDLRAADAWGRLAEKAAFVERNRARRDVDARRLQEDTVDD